MESKTKLLEPILARQPVIPVVQIDDVADAVPLANALVKGGLPVIEITLRSDAALDALKAIVDQVPQAIVGAGTVLTRAQYNQAAEYGAKFIVTPGYNSELFGAAVFSPVPTLLGAITPGEILEAMHRGYHHLKFFPAQASGGIEFMKALAGPFPQIKFCPTGGITVQNAAEWLALPNVICVGGSWLTPKELIQQKKWEAITQLAQQAMQLR